MLTYTYANESAIDLLEQELRAAGMNEQEVLALRSAADKAAVSQVYMDAKNYLTSNTTLSTQPLDDLEKLHYETIDRLLKPVPTQRYIAEIEVPDDTSPAEMDKIVKKN